MTPGLKAYHSLPGTSEWSSPKEEYHLVRALSLWRLSHRDMYMYITTPKVSRILAVLSSSLACLQASQLDHVACKKQESLRDEVTCKNLHPCEPIEWRTYMYME